MAIKRSRMTLESTAALSHDPIVKLPAAAARSNRQDREALDGPVGA